MSTLEIVFERQKTSAEGHSQTLTQSDLVFINPGIYLHSMATVIGKSAKKQFPAYVGEFWSMSQRLLEIYSGIYENMIDENYSSFTKTGPNKGNYKPDEPENHRKERKEGKGARAREKKTSNSL